MPPSWVFVKIEIDFIDNSQPGGWIPCCEARPMVIMGIQASGTNATDAPMRLHPPYNTGAQGKWPVTSRNYVIVDNFKCFTIQMVAGTAFLFAFCNTCAGTCFYWQGKRGCSCVWSSGTRAVCRQSPALISSGRSRRGSVEGAISCSQV